MNNDFKAEAINGFSSIVSQAKIQGDSRKNIKICESLFEDAFSHVALLFSNNQAPIGFATYTIQSSQDADSYLDAQLNLDVEIHSVYLLPRYRQKGLAGDLMEQIMVDIEQTLVDVFLSIPEHCNIFISGYAISAEGVIFLLSLVELLEGELPCMFSETDLFIHPNFDFVNGLEKSIPLKSFQPYDKAA